MCAVANVVACVSAGAFYLDYTALILPIDLQAMKESDGEPRVLKTTSLERDLGVLVSNNLKATSHCQAAAKKGSRALRLLKMTFSNLTLGNFKVLYSTYVRPHLDYCLQAVGPHMVQDIQQLEKVQRRATKLVHEIKYLPYPEILLKLDLLSIKERALHGDFIEVYKIVTGKMDIDPGQFFEMQDNSIMRGHHSKLKNRRACHHYRNMFFASRVVTPWNNLPEHVVSAPSVNSFKRRLDQYWATQAFSFHFHYIQVSFLT